jgi:exo-1,4-beta-D-glucosaminidase
LVLKNPQLWWPYQMGKPQMHSLRVEFLIDGRVSDAQDVSFGIRDIRSRINEHGARVFSINGKEILIRGAAWAPDLMYRQSRERDEADIAFVKNSNMNAIRFEGNLGSDYMMELCDREGILVMAGWSCCNHWENWKYWKPGDMIIARESLISQLKRLRNHPSLMVWLYGSDFPPPEQVERVYLSVLREIAPQVSYLSNASAKPSVLQGKTGVKMSGPYNYVPPVYWYTDAMPGVAENFNTETGPEVCVPVIGSIRKFIPGDDFTQTGASWNHHAGLAMFPDTSIVNKAIERRFGKPGDLKEHAACAQVLGYECWRAMYEAYGRNFPRGTGVIGWMLNSSWPSVFWQLYDYYLEPTGAFFGSKKACEPLHIQYSYDDKSIWVVHTRFDTMREVSAEIKLFTNDSLCIFEKRLSLTIKPYDRVPIHTIAGNKAESPVYFLFLSLKHEGEIVSRNCYWLSSTEDVFIEKRKLRTKFYWPVEKHADFTALRALAGATIEYTGSFTVHDNENRIRVTIVNTSAALAFFLKARIYDKNTKEYSAPVFWDDNCVTLQPNERIVLSGTFKKSINIEQMAVVVEGWNAGDSFIK